MMMTDSLTLLAAGLPLKSSVLSDDEEENVEDEVREEEDGKGGLPASLEQELLSLSRECCDGGVEYVEDEVNASGHEQEGLPGSVAQDLVSFC